MPILVVIVIVIFISILVVPSIGLLAIYKEDFGLAITFAILMTLTTISTIYLVVLSVVYIPGLLTKVALTAMAYKFAMDCNTIDENRRRGIVSGTIGLPSQFVMQTLSAPALQIAPAIVDSVPVQGYAVNRNTPQSVAYPQMPQPYVQATHHNPV